MINKETVLEFMRGQSYHPLSGEEMARALGINRKAEEKAFLELLAEMEQEAAVIRTRKQKYGLPEKMGLVVGRMDAKAGGFGFVVPRTETPEPDLHISSSHMNGAMHRDEVVARLLHRTGRNGRPEGEIIRIVERANRQVVGTLERNRRYGFVVPDDSRLDHDIFINQENLGEARSGDKVVVEMIRWPEPRRNPEGRIVEVLGQAGDAGVDILSIIRKYGLPEEFPQPVMEESQRISPVVEERDRTERRDLRSWTMVTIDGADARDLDDAVSLTVLKNGNFSLGVHIADVAYYVKEGAALDQEALERGTSVYLPDRVVPMLPPQLSNGICSLNAGVERLALTCVMEIDGTGRVKKYEIFPSLILIDRRLTYDLVKRFLADGDGEAGRELGNLGGLLPEMEKLCLTLRERRLRRGAIDFDFPESKVLLDEEGKPTKIVKRERSIAEQIIEEFMIAANETVARHLVKLELPALYRVHQEPDKGDLKAVNEFLQGLGYRVKISSKGIHPRSYQEVIEQVKGRPEEKLISTVLLRSMKHARYAPSCLGHFGLASQYYCHFTSPIRRYPDLLVHRALRATLAVEPAGPKVLEQWGQKMPGWAEVTSLREQRAEEAEREAVDLKKVEYMARFLGEVFPGIISGVTSFGLFVELENTVEGLVHISTLTDDYYLYLEGEHRLLGQHTKRQFRLGDPVTVQVAKVSVADRRIDFELVSSP